MARTVLEADLFSPLGDDLTTMGMVGGGGAAAAEGSDAPAYTPLADLDTLAVMGGYPYDRAGEGDDPGNADPAARPSVVVALDMGEEATEAALPAEKAEEADRLTLAEEETHLEAVSYTHLTLPTILLV